MNEHLALPEEDDQPEWLLPTRTAVPSVLMSVMMVTLVLLTGFVLG